MTPRHYLCFAGLAVLVVTPGRLPAAFTPGEEPASRAPASWKWEWKPAPGEGIPEVEVSPFRYGKRWAYGVEIDDGPASTHSVSQPLLAEYGFTNAPPGVSGGQRLPFVGGAAIIVLRTGSANQTFLNWQQLRELQAKGWAVVNHGYAHVGNHWEPSAALTPPQIRRELFWSQAIVGAELGEASVPSHFVYPNGYVAYRPHLAEFGLRSASRVAGSSKGGVDEAGFVPADLNRNYLDEGVWAKANDPLVGLPNPPRPGSLVIDFTHGMEADPQSPNGRRWRERLGHLESRYGCKGDDTMWCASTPEVINYTLARRGAAVSAARGRIEAKLPEGLPATRLTLHVTGLSLKTVLQPPPEATLFRQGTEAWITTPEIGAPSGKLAGPRLKRVYRGPVGPVRLDRPERIAGVRILQAGKPAVGFKLAIRLRTERGPVTVVETEPAAQWGSWNLYPLVPEREAVLAQEVEANTDPALKEMEVWAVAE